ncbi:MAG TPA: IS3 family transposase [Gemmatimonadales bacterium]|nr:IS3 family transposase [Gemmatimonadales bacterium]
MIARHRGEYPLTLMCRVLTVSRSGFHAWQTRAPSARATADAGLRVRIAATHQRARQEYGARLHRKELQAAGVRISRRRVRRVMHEAGCRAIRARRWQVTTQTDPTLAVAPNHLARQFTVPTPNRVWAADLTYCWTQEGWLYLAVVLDLCSRRVVGWATSRSPDHHVALAAWQRAVAVRQPARGLVHHSDRGSIYSCAPYRAALTDAQAIASMSRRGDCWDNAVVESFFATLKLGLVHRQTWATRSSLTRALVDYIDGWYNPERRHSHLGYVSPIAYEAQLTRAA